VLHSAGQMQNQDAGNSQRRGDGLLPSEVFLQKQECAKYLCRCRISEKLEVGRLHDGLTCSP
jgi:hypothetical protein